MDAKKVRMGRGDLSRRERQIMDVVYERGEASAAEVREGLPHPPSYSAVRALLALLVKKGFLGFKEEGPRYVYYPTLSKKSVRDGMLRHLMRTFYDNSAEQLMSALLNLSGRGLSDGEYDRLMSLVRKAREEGR